MLMILCLCNFYSMLGLASETSDSLLTIQPYSIINYGDFNINSGGTKYLTNNGGNFTIRSRQTVSVLYSASASLYIYFHNSSTGGNIRVFTSYTPNCDVVGYFYISNPNNTSVYVSNVSVSY